MKPLLKAQKQFDAVLAKNAIARMVRISDKSGDTISIGAMMVYLEDIEEYTGQMNQPCIRDILNDKTGNI